MSRHTTLMFPYLDNKPLLVDHEKVDSNFCCLHVVTAYGVLNAGYMIMCIEEIEAIGDHSEKKLP